MTTKPSKPISEYKCQVVKEDGTVCNKPAVGMLGLAPDELDPSTAFCVEHRKSILGWSDTDVRYDKN
jgi:hypothetical protein